MKHRLSHNQRMQQKMALTPQMRQSLRLLGMPIKELSEYIESMLEKNPFLRKEVSQSLGRRDQTKTTSTRTFADDIEIPVATREDPRLSLISQIKMMDKGDEVVKIAEYIIYELDDNGYLKVDAEEAAADLGAAPEEVEYVISLIQKLDPPGIGARDVAECLQLQLERSGRKASLEYKIIGSFLNEMTRGDVEKIAGELDTDTGNVTRAIAEIKKLNPRPASSMLSKETKNIIPEIFARVEAKKVRLELNRDPLPRLKIYNPYREELDIIKDPEARRFLKENIDAAKSLLDGLKRREDTICKVANYILGFQRDALVAEESELKSLTRKEIARALDFHPSTISRVVSNKFISVNDNTVPFKSLLNGCVKRDNGGSVSRAAVDRMIADMVKAEDQARPLSDSALTDMLEKKGIIIKRRTVAKYREALRILPSRMRRKSAKRA